MNKNTVKAIQKRLDNGQPAFTIGNYWYVEHSEHAEFIPYVLRYSQGSSNPFHVGNIVDGIFIPSDFPERR